MKTIAFFNNKGGVGKTSLVYHLAWMFADKGRKVLAVDLDPQANLSSMFLDEERLEQLWDETKGRSIAESLRPLQDGEGLGRAYVETIHRELGLIVGNLALSRFEDRLSESWGKCLDRDVLAFRFMSAFYTLIQDAANQMSAEVVLIDVGPNLGAINRAVMIAADHVVIPLAADLFSLQGMKNLGPTLRVWREGWTERLDKATSVKFPLPKGQMQPSGYVMMHHVQREGRPVKAYQAWAEKIPSVYRSEVLNEPLTKKVGIVTDSNQLAMLKHYRSLMPMAQDAHKPIFHLTSADGAIGAHIYAVRECYDDFSRLADRIALNVGL